MITNTSYITAQYANEIFSATVEGVNEVAMVTVMMLLWQLEKSHQSITSQFV